MTDAEMELCKHKVTKCKKNWWRDSHTWDEWIGVCDISQNTYRRHYRVCLTCGEWEYNGSPWDKSAWEGCNKPVVYLFKKGFLEQVEDQGRKMSASGNTLEEVLTHQGLAMETYLGDGTRFNISEHPTVKRDLAVKRQIDRTDSVEKALFDKAIHGDTPSMKLWFINRGFGKWISGDETHISISRCGGEDRV